MNMFTTYLRASALILPVIANGCNQPSSPPLAQETEQYLSDPNSVPFDIEPVKSAEGHTVWLATYSSQGKIARFKLELEPSTALADKESKEFDIRSGKGRIRSEPDSDASVLLSDLKKALEAKTLPTKVRRTSSLLFTYVTFGERNSQSPGGGFSAKPAGNWTAMKIFLGEGEQEGQVFLNLNPKMRKGQFSMKDSDYGDIVLAYLVKVL
jgi:hypothetical protein